MAGCLAVARGSTLGLLTRFAIACLASAVVLQLQGYPTDAEHLRKLSIVAERLPPCCSGPVAVPLVLRHAAAEILHVAGIHLRFLRRAIVGGGHPNRFS